MADIRRPTLDALLVELDRALGTSYAAVLFGSAARGDDFDPARSDADFLVTFEPAVRNDLGALVELKDELEELLGRPVDLVEREVVETSRNFIRRQAILRDAKTIYG